MEYREVAVTFVFASTQRLPHTMALMEGLLAGLPDEWFDPDNDEPFVSRWGLTFEGT